jgi:hypothetical protein
VALARNPFTSESFNDILHLLPVQIALFLHSIRHL